MKEICVDCTNRFDILKSYDVKMCIFIILAITMKKERKTFTSYINTTFSKHGFVRDMYLSFIPNVHICMYI